VSSAPRRVLIDCDPGHDDALAILFAAGSAAIDLVGITTVAGNQTVDKTTANAATVATVAGLRGVPVVRGCDRPLLRELRTAPAFHGESGMDGPTALPRPSAVTRGHAVDFIVDTVMAAPGEVTLVATGPLTNLALAVRKAPEIVEAVQGVVIMGGAYGHGNVTPAAEFNIFVDPEAASIVFGACWSLTMIGLDVTHEALCTEDVQRAIEAIDAPVGPFAGGLLTFFRAAYAREAGMPDPPLHDACAVAYVADPTLFDVFPARVAVETGTGLAAGMTVTDFGGRDGQVEGSTCAVAVGLHRDAFWEAMLEGLSSLGARMASPAEVGQ
jgi:purine nucleosidase